MRLPAFAPGTRVLIVDQWVETGGTVDGAIRLIERQRGHVAGIVAIAIEENEQTRSYRENYRCVSAVLPGSNWQDDCNAQALQSFKSYRPEDVFPRTRQKHSSLAEKPKSPPNRF